MRSRSDRWIEVTPSSSHLSARAWRRYVISCRTALPTMPGRTLSSGTIKANGMKRCAGVRQCAHIEAGIS